MVRILVLGALATVMIITVNGVAQHLKSMFCYLIQ